MGKYLLAVLAALLVGVTKTGLPGLGILIVPLFALVLPARASTGALLPLLIAGDIIAVLYYRQRAVWPKLLRLLPWAAAGVVLGYLAMGRIADAQFQPLLGAVILGLLALNLWRERRPAASFPGRWWFAAAMGLLAGVTTMIANAAGPVMVIYLLAMGLSRTEFIATGAWYFFLVNCLKVPFSMSLGLINRGSLALDAPLALAVAAGAAIGIGLAKRIPEKAFNRLVQVLTLAAAVRMLW